MFFYEPGGILIYMILATMGIVVFLIVYKMIPKPNKR